MGPVTRSPDHAKPVPGLGMGTPVRRRAKAQRLFYRGPIPAELGRVGPRSPGLQRQHDRRGRAQHQQAVADLDGTDHAGVENPSVARGLADVSPSSGLVRDRLALGEAARERKEKSIVEREAVSGRRVVTTAFIDWRTCRMG